MRKAPINYLVTYALLALSWIVFAVLLGNYLGENVALTNTTSEDFSRTYQLVLAAGALLSALASTHWYWTGVADSAATDLSGAQRLWSGWFFVLVITSVVCLAGMVIGYRDESFTWSESLLMFGSSAAVTFAPYWVSSLWMSPRGVKHAPLGMR